MKGLFVAAAVSLACVACASPDNSEPAAASSAGSSATSSTIAATATNEARPIVKQVGDAAGVGDWIRFGITNVQVADTCTGLAAYPPKGEYVIAGFEVKTSPDYATAKLPDGRSVKMIMDSQFVPTTWEAIGPDGAITATTEGYGCAARDVHALRGPFDSASTYSGTYVFDAPKGSNALVLSMSGSGSSLAWQWNLP